jgi:hypothetical protein
VPPTRLTKILVAAAALALSVSACSGGDDDEAKPDTETSAAEFDLPVVELELTRAELVSPHAPKSYLDAETTEAVTDVVERLLLVTSAGPLAEGKAGGGFPDLFTPDAGARAAGDDRAVFFDEGVRRFGTLKLVTATIGMTGLAGTMDPATGVVVATYEWTVDSTEHPGDRVARRGEISLVPDGKDWKIGAYTIVVTRTVDRASTTTTASSTSTEVHG